jgi:signal transduction histidine kinase/DNA-binding response OmpR family regulator
VGKSRSAPRPASLAELKTHSYLPFATSGFFKKDKKTGQYRQYTEQQHLIPGPSVRKIFEDHRQNLWIATEKYLARYNPETDRFIPFTTEDGIRPTSYFNPNVYHDRNNYIYLPTPYDIVNYFHPDSFKINTTVPPVYFTDFQLASHLVRPGDSTAILQKSLDFTEKITLQYAQNDFTIHYTAPEYIHPNETVFAIQLEGFNDDWQEVGNKREARYTNLSPGTYTFKAKVRNHHGFWSETPRTLKIVVLPPWYRTWWAYLLYALTVGGILFAVRNYELKRQLAKAEALRLQELDLAKSRLYNNITHEFRTPLTVILGMAEQVKNDPKNWFNEGLQLIRRNGKQLLNLVNQMLDLSKLESGHIPLKLVNGDIVSFLHYLTESFHSYADSKDIRLHFRSDYPELQMDYDPEKLQNVVSNLLSNAIKFTPSGGDVYFDLRFPNNDLRLEEAIVNPNTEIVIQVSDNGPGIAAEHLPFIFDRFYQADNTDTRRGEGTGIGLALVKELVKVMGGRIEVESPYAGPGGKGTRFSIWLPVTRTAAPPDPLKGETLWQNPADISDTIKSELSDYGSPFRGSGGGGADRFTVLLVEDNPDVVTYLTSVLSLHYRIATARNGQEGIEKAFELVPDLIVSDVMMPEKDGFELCHTLKTDERTSHIPIVLLTAKADQKSKIEGLTYGADAYLAKPFHQEELLVRVEKLIELRRRMQERFRTAGSLQQVIDTPPQSIEDQFLQKVIRIIQAQMSDENFGMPQLCKELNMSRTNLFRKLKALTGKSTTLFIRTLRLEKARTLLETTELNVTEACFAAGFNSPNYFSRVFQEEFGVAPSEVRKQ